MFQAKASGQAHVPFRDSRLTYLMEPCLSGQGKTLMLVNVAPELANAPESLCSLRFAKKVNQCDTGGGARPGAKRSAKPMDAASSDAAPKSARPASAAAVSARGVRK